MKNIVCKFGGSSLADSQNIKLVANIVLSKGRNFVVVSAPGKRYKDDVKITDALIDCYNSAIKSQSFDKSFSFIKKRYREIVKELNLNLDLNSIFDEIYNHLLYTPQYDYVVSRGEYICAIIMSHYIKYDFIDAKDFIIFNDFEEVDIEASKKRIAKLIKQGHRYVIPGFYGSDKSGNIKAFSRGGSDITGAVVSLLLDAEIYENYTDVDGIMSVNPKLYKHARVVPFLSYDEIRCLSFSGANVLHADCTRFLKQNDIKLNLLNTFNPEAKGSMASLSKPHNDIIAISSISGMSMISIRAFDLNLNVSKIKDLLSLLTHSGVSIYHLQFGLDCLNVLTLSKKNTIDRFKENGSKMPLIEKIDVVKDLSIVSIVGESIMTSKKVENKLYKLIASTQCKIHAISKDCQNPQITLVVEESDTSDFINYINEELSI